MKKVFFFGDSNTWGYQFETNSRLNYESTWPLLLANQINLSQSHSIIPIVDGLNGRVTNIDDPIWANRNAAHNLSTTLEIHDPIEIAVIMLGTNDTKTRLSRSADDILSGIQELTKIVRQGEWSLSNNRPQILLISPPNIINENAFDGEFIGARNKLNHLSSSLENFAKDENITFFNSTGIQFQLCTDGVHLNKEDHAKLAKQLVVPLSSLL